MNFDRSAMSFAGLAIMISGVMHGVIPVASGFAAETMMLIPFFFIYIAIGYGLMRKMRWLAWLTFFVMIIGMSSAIYYSFAGPVQWGFMIMAAANIATFLCLFAALWRPKVATTA